MFNIVTVDDSDGKSKKMFILFAVIMAKMYGEKTIREVS